MMLAAAGIFLAARRKPALPYDAEVEYLESTGTQWIDTGVLCETTALSVDATLMTLSYAIYRGFFGAYLNEDSNAFRLLLTSANNGKAWATCGYIARKSLECLFSINQWHHISLYNNGNFVIIDGTTYQGGSGTVGGANNANIHLFRADNPSSASQHGSNNIRIADFSMASNAVLVRDFIPVRFTNEQGQSEGAMYDRASGQLFRNSGTGAFTIGPDKTA